jgi:hypothetical protein
VNLTISSRVIFADALASVPGRIGVINQPPHIVTFRVALRDEFDPLANVSIQATERSVYNKNGSKHKLVDENIDHNCYIAKRKKATCESCGSNEQKKEINRSDPLFLAETASVSKDLEQATKRSDYYAISGRCRRQAATITSATGYAEDCAEKFYQQGGLAIASIRHDGSGCIQRMMFVRKDSGTSCAERQKRRFMPIRPTAQQWSFSAA